MGAGDRAGGRRRGDAGEGGGAMHGRGVRVRKLVEEMLPDEQWVVDVNDSS